MQDDSCDEVFNCEQWGHDYYDCLGQDTRNCSTNPSCVCGLEGDVPDADGDCCSPLLIGNGSCDNRRRVTAGSGTYGYIITRKGAAKALTICHHLSAPIDLRLITHSPVCDCYKPQHLCPTQPDLELESYMCKTPYVVHNDRSFSYVNQSNSN